MLHNRHLWNDYAFVALVRFVQAVADNGTDEQLTELLSTVIGSVDPGTPRVMQNVLSWFLNTYDYADNLPLLYQPYIIRSIGLVESLLLLEWSDWSSDDANRWTAMQKTMEQYFGWDLVHLHRLILIGRGSSNPEFVERLQLLYSRFRSMQPPDNRNISHLPPGLNDPINVDDGLEAVADGLGGGGNDSTDDYDDVDDDDNDDNKGLIGL